VARPKRHRRFRRRSAFGACIVLAVAAGIAAGWLSLVRPAAAQTYAPGTTSQVAPSGYQGNTELDNIRRDDDAAATELQRAQVFTRAPVPVVPPQPFMREILWRDVFGRPIPRRRATPCARRRGAQAHPLARRRHHVVFQGVACGVVFEGRQKYSACMWVISPDRADVRVACGGFVNSMTAT